MDQLMQGGSLGRSTATLSSKRRGVSFGLGMDIFTARSPQRQIPADVEEEDDCGRNVNYEEFGPEKLLEIQVRPR